MKRGLPEGRSAFQPITNNPWVVPLATSSRARRQGSKCVEQSILASLHILPMMSAAGPETMSPTSQLKGAKSLVSNFNSAPLVRPANNKHGVTRTRHKPVF